MSDRKYRQRGYQDEPGPARSERKPAEKKEYAPRGVVFQLVYLGTGESSPAIYRHLRDFEYPCGALRDPQYAFARKSRVRVTPEAAVFRPDGTLLYHGRIDDRYASVGVERPSPSRRDLQDVLSAIVEGRTPAPRTTEAVGCFIADVVR